MTTLLQGDGGPWWIASFNESARPSFEGPFSSLGDCVARHRVRIAQANDRFNQAFERWNVLKTERAAKVAQMDSFSVHPGTARVI